MQSLVKIVVKIGLYAAVAVGAFIISLFIGGRSAGHDFYGQHG